MSDRSTLKGAQDDLVSKGIPRELFDRNPDAGRAHMIPRDVRFIGNVSEEHEKVWTWGDAKESHP